MADSCKLSDKLPAYKLEHNKEGIGATALADPNSLKFFKDLRSSESSKSSSLLHDCSIVGDASNATIPAATSSDKAVTGATQNKLPTDKNTDSGSLFDPEKKTKDSLPVTPHNVPPIDLRPFEGGPFDPEKVPKDSQKVPTTKMPPIDVTPFIK